MGKIESSPCGIIYLSSSGFWYIKDDKGDFHQIRPELFSPISEAVHNCFDIHGSVINFAVEQCSKETFCEYLIKHKLYNYIEDKDIPNKVI